MDRAAELAEFARLRESCPVSGLGPGGHLLVRYADTVAVLRAAESFDALVDPAVPVAARAQWARDPDEHRGRRQRLFTVDRIAEATDGVAETGRRLITAAAMDERCELVADLIAPVTRGIIADLVGLPADDRDRVFGWVATMGESSSRPDHERAEAWRAGGDPLRAWVVGERIHRRSVPTVSKPADGIELLLEADQLTGRTPTDDELFAYVYLLCRSGVGPLARLLGNVIHRLALERSLLDDIRAEPAVASEMVEEVLCDDPPIQYLMRDPVREVVLHGQVMAPGDRVVMSVTSANRDIGRDPRGRLKHVAFGRGERFCPAASFGRHVAAQLARDLADLVAEIRLHADADLAALHAPSVWTPVRLPASLEARPRR